MRTFLQNTLKNAVRILMFALLCLFGLSQKAQAQTQTYNTSGSFNTPAGVTTVQVEAWGGGGGGGGADGALFSTRSGGGGGGGAYRKTTGVVVTPNAAVTVTVGAGGNGGNAADGTAGGASSFASTSPVTAAGGGGGIAGVSGDTTGAGGAGGIGTFNGGTGGTASTSNSGGGGGGAGTTGAGGNGGAPTAGTAGAGGGGIGAAGTSSAANGTSATALAGGGSGARTTNNTNRTGGNGAAGRVVVTYVCPTYALTAPATATGPFCSPQTSTVTLRSSSLPSGTYTVTYNLSGATSATGSTSTMTFTAGSPGTGTFATSSLSTGTTTITITSLTSSYCSSSQSANNTASVTILPPPTSNPGNAFSVCYTSGAIAVNPDSSASTTNASSVIWSGGAGTWSNATSLTAAAYTPTAGEISAGSVSVTLTAVGNPPCGNTSNSKTITIKTAITANAGVGQNICAGGTATLSANSASPGTGAWTILAGSPSTSTAQFSSTSNPAAVFTPSGGAGTYTLRWTITNSPCAANSDDVVIVVDLPATVNAGVDQIICNNSPVVNLSGTRGGSATSSLWTGGAGTIADPTALNTTYTPSAGELAAGGNVTLTLTSNDPPGPCGAVSDTMVITINLAASANAGANQDYCTSTASVSISGTRGGTGVTSSTWTTSGTGTFGNAANLSTTYTPSAADKNLASVTLTLTTNNPSGPCGAASSSMVITIFPAATVNAGSDQSACSGQPITLAGTMGGGASSVTWSAPSGTFSNVNSLTSTYTPSIAQGTVTLTLTTNDPVGPCGPVSSTMTVTVRPVPVTTGAVICQGTPGTTISSSTNCPIETATNNAGPNISQTAVEDQAVGSKSWTTPGNITAAGSPYATCALTFFTQSYYLKGTNYGFSIPAGSTIRGIQVSINRLASGSAVSDSEVKLVKNGLIQSAENKTGGAWPTVLGVATYGGTTDLWSNSWTVSDINNSNFGVVLSVNSLSLSNRTATVDYMTITVTYSLPGQIRWYTAASGGSLIGTGSSINPVGAPNSPLVNTNTPGTYYFYAECSSVVGCRTQTAVIINPLPTVSFTPMNAVYCQDAAIVNLVGSPAGGTFSGAGIANTGGGTATFNASVAGVGPHAIVYSYTDGNTCTNTSTQNINVNANVTYYRDFDGDSYGNPALTTVSCTGAPLGYVADNTDCNDNDATKHAQYPFYVDADGDTYGTGSLVSVCAVNAVTPPANFSLNNTDCNDADATKHAEYPFYADVDGDGYGAGSSINVCAVDAGTPPAGYSTNNTDCAPSNPAMHATYPFFVDGDGDGYGSTTIANVCAINGSTPPSAGYVLNSTDCDDTKSSVHPGATEIGYNLIDDDCDGLVDEGFPPIVTTITGGQCNSFLPAIDAQLIADIVPGAQGYRWKITTMSGPSTGQVQLLDTPLRVMKLVQLANYQFNTQYKVELGVYYAGYLQPYQASNCTVTTPVVTTKLAQCGQAINAMTNVIYANSVAYASGYRFRITDPLNGANTQTLDRPIREFRMNLITAFTVQYGKTYNVEVAVKNTDGSYMPYGQICTVTTPTFPTTSLEDAICEDFIVPDNNTQIYAYSVPGAVAYVFKLTGPALPPAGSEITKSLRAFRMSDFTGLIPGATYNVQVRVVFNFNDPIGPFGKTCTIIAPGLSRAIKQPFAALAYPNPFAENFGIDVKTASNEKIDVKVYDMTGRMLEAKSVDVSDVKSLEIGDSYPAGVYNVIVGQGEEVKTLRVIKR